MSFQEGERVTVNVLLKTLKEAYGKKFTDYVYDAETGQVRSFLQLLVNGRSTSTMNGLRTMMKDGDVLAILPPVGGG